MAETYDVYVGIDPGSLTVYASGISDLSINIPTVWVIYGLLGYATTYYWRVDATNEYGTTEGDVWSFTTIAFDPPLPTGVTLDGDGEPTGTPTGVNNMITIRRLVAVANNALFYEDI